MSFASLFAEQQLASYTKGVWNISSLPQGVEKFEIEDVVRYSIIITIGTIININLIKLWML